MTTYASIAADINNALETFYYIKIGTTNDYPINRCDKQRLKLVWTTRKDSEQTVLEMAKKIHGSSPHDYKCAGFTESFGNFKTALDALIACLELSKIFKGSDKLELAVTLAEGFKNGQ